MQVKKCVYFVVHLQLCALVFTASLRLPTFPLALFSSENLNVTHEEFLNPSRELQMYDLYSIMFETRDDLAAAVSIHRTLATSGQSGTT